MYLFPIYLLMGLIRLTKSNPHFMKIMLVMKLLVSLCYSVLNSMFIDNCHKFGNTGEYPYALLATNTLCPRFCKLLFWMGNAHHRFPHAFLVTLWGFLSLCSNASKLGLDLDNVICLIPTKNIKLSKLNFSFSSWLY
jgi:hypothetical protein